MEDLTAASRKVFDNMSRVLNPNVSLGSTLQEIIDALSEVGTPVNASNASKVLTISGVSVHGETVTIGDDVFEFVADDALTVSDPDNIPIDITSFVAKASVSLSIATQPTSGDKMTIGTKVYTFVPVGTDTADGEISIGADLAGAKAAIVAAINGDGEFNLPHPLVTISDFDGDLAIVTALVGGTAGNSIPTTSLFTAVSDNLFGNTHLTTGSNCSLANTVTALTDAINNDGTQDVTAVAGSGLITLTADVAGDAGNDIALAKTMANGAFAGSATHLSGGVDGTVASAGKLYVDGSYLYLCVADNTISGKNWLSMTIQEGGTVGGYIKPVDGIPAEDLEDTYYILPENGIPETDLEEASQSKLDQLMQLLGALGESLTFKLVATPETLGSSASAANAAAPGDFKKNITLNLLDSNDDLVIWYNGSATVVPSENAVDEDIGVPVVTGGNTIQFVGGVGLVELVYDTNVGSTKEYAAGDTIGFTVTLDEKVGALWTPSYTHADFLDTFVAGGE